MSISRVGLIDKTGQMDPDSVAAVADAINIQVMRDLAPVWNVQATVQHYPSGKIPMGVWPVFIVSHLPPGEGGYHTDRNNQPYAKVVGGPGDDSWTIDVSHEIIEMLVDPYGNRTQSSLSIAIDNHGVKDGTGQFDYLVEACDPCEASQFGYQVNGVLVSDFITPHYYEAVSVVGARYSFTGAVTAPRQLLPGGYISFFDEDAGEWHQILFLDPNGEPVERSLGPAQGSNIREWIDGHVARDPLKREHWAKVRHVEPVRRQALEMRRNKLAGLASRRAQHFSRLVSPKTEKAKH